MPPHVFARCFDANDPHRLARTWAGVLTDIGQGEASGVVLADPDGDEFCVLTPR
jgi:hypothetical protein